MNANNPAFGEAYVAALDPGRVKRALRPEYVEEIRNNVSSLPFAIEPLGEIAYRAYSGTSQSPEVRMVQEEMEYTRHLKAFADEILPHEGNGSEAFDALRDYAVKYREKRILWLNAMSHCISTFVTGGANFPVRKAENANRREHERRREMMEWTEKAQKMVKKRLGLIQGLSDPIRSDDKDALAKLRSKLEYLKRRHTMAIEANRLLRTGKSDSEKLAGLRGIGYDMEDISRKLVVSGGKIGSLHFDTVNVLAEAKRIRARIDEVEKRSSEKSCEYGFGDGRVIDNTEEKRVQIKYSGKPDSETITRLKLRGFHWSARNGAWQRLRTPEALRVAKLIAGVAENAAPVERAAQPSDPRIVFGTVPPPRAERPPVNENEELAARRDLAVTDLLDLLKEGKTLIVSTDGDGLRFCQGNPDGITVTDGKGRLTMKSRREFGGELLGLRDNPPPGLSIRMRKSFSCEEMALMSSEANDRAAEKKRPAASVPPVVPAVPPANELLYHTELSGRKEVSAEAVFAQIDKGATLVVQCVATGDYYFAERSGKSGYVFTLPDGRRKDVVPEYAREMIGKYLCGGKYSLELSEAVSEEAKKEFSTKSERELSRAEKAMREIDEAISGLEKKIESPETEKTVREWLAFHERFHVYSPMNTLGLYIQCKLRGTVPERFAAFRKWTEIKNGEGVKVKVKQGEKGYSILFPMQGIIYEKDENGKYRLDQSGRRIPRLDPDTGKPQEYIWFSVGYVFDVNQTTAKEIGAYKDLGHRGEAVPVTDELVAKLAERITKEYGFPVNFINEPAKGAGGWFDMEKREITVNDAVAKENSHKLGTLFHELGHGILHSREREKYTRGVAEGQAEAFAYASSLAFGVERKSELYIKNWTDGENVKLIDVLKNIGAAVREARERLGVDELAAQEHLQRFESEKFAAEMSGNAPAVASSAADAASASDYGYTVVETLQKYVSNFNATRKYAEYVNGLSPERLAVLYAIVKDSEESSLAFDFTAARLCSEIKMMRKRDKLVSKQETNPGQLCLAL